MIYVCPDCNEKDRLFKWRKFKNGSMHIEETCARCGRFIQWAPQTPEAIAAADAVKGQGQRDLFGGEQ